MFRKHQRLNTYTEERASAAATRQAQAQTVTATPYTAQTLAALKLYTQMATDAWCLNRTFVARSAFVERVDGVLLPTDYARQLLEAVQS